MKKKDKINTVVVPVFNTEYSAVVCWGSVKKLRRILKALKYPKIDLTNFKRDGIGRGKTFLREDRHPLIMLAKKPDDFEYIGTLAHEACHAVDHIFDSIGQPLGNEAYAHSVGAIVREVLKIRNSRVK